MVWPIIAGQPVLARHVRLRSKPSQCGRIRGIFLSLLIPIGGHIHLIRTLHITGHVLGPGFGVACSISWIGRRLSRLDCYVLDRVSDSILDDDLIPAVVGDGVVEQLRRSWV